MFTGIVAAVGYIQKVLPLVTSGADSGHSKGGVKVTIYAPGFGFDDIELGDSIAIQGACMTVVAIRAQEQQFDVDVSAESLSKTIGLSFPGPVNLEKSLALGDKLGGHLVSGHVDGLGKVLVFEAVGESWRLDIEVPIELGQFFATKGSATVNGVSLTTNTVTDHKQGSVFSINVIPHTLEVTTLRHLKVGDSVNVEIDLFARYCERMMRYRSQH
jgi:riboflavin synthase